MNWIRWSLVAVAVVAGLDLLLLGMADVDLATTVFGAGPGSGGRTLHTGLGLAGIAAVMSLLVLGKRGPRVAPGQVGRSEGERRGPLGGEGAVVHESSGTADFDGLPGDVLPPGDGVEPDPESVKPDS